MLFKYFLVAPFSQADVMSTRNSQIADEGACHSFVLNWLRLIMDKPAEPAKNRLAAIKQKSGGINIVLQRAFGTRFESDLAEYLTADAMLLRLRGLTADPAIFDATSYNYTQLEKEITPSDSSGFIYTIYFFSAQEQEDSAHTVGIYRMNNPKGTDEGIVLFDPNFGEFKVPLQDFQAWFGFYAQYIGRIDFHILRPIRITGEGAT